jgi:predicted acyl esterase
MPQPRPLRRMSAFLLLAALLLPARAQTPPKQTFMVPMRDGIRLATDVWLPPGKGPFPVILARTPYNKDAGAGLAPGYTSRGYALVAQDTRGRFASEGKNMAFETDGWADGKEDGYDTVEWIAKQPWCSGKIGTWGGSALGITQLLMAATNPPHLVCQYIVVGTPSFYRDAAYPGGVFHKSLVEDWLRATKMDPEQLKTWVSHSTDDAYWQARDLSGRWKQTNVPAIHIGGWYDIFTQGTIDAFTGYQTKGGPGARGRQKLIMGPWTHGVGQRRVGQFTFPPNASAPPDNAMDQWRWYDHWLMGRDNGVEKEPAVAYYVMGDTTDPGAPGNVWRTASTWPPPAKAQAWFLHADRTLSPIPPSDRTLSPTPPGSPPSKGGDSPETSPLTKGGNAKHPPLTKGGQGGVGSLTYTYDPKNPVPTTGGNHLTLPAGPMEQSAVEARPDVLVFTSAPLDKALEVTGRVRAVLQVSSDCPDTDFTVKLCDVYPDGRSFNVCDGILRARFRRSFTKPELMKPGQVYPLDIDLWSTSLIFNRGHRLRVQVSSSNAPAYDPNPNTGAPFRADDRTQVARNTLYMDAKRPSRLLLPVAVNGGDTK